MFFNKKRRVITKQFFLRFPIRYEDDIVKITKIGIDVKKEQL